MTVVKHWGSQGQATEEEMDEDQEVREAYLLVEQQASDCIHQQDLTVKQKRLQEALDPDVRITHCTLKQKDVYCSSRQRATLACAHDHTTPHSSRPSAYAAWRRT